MKRGIDFLRICLHFFTFNYSFICNVYRDRFGVPGAWVQVAFQHSG